MAATGLCGVCRRNLAWRAEPGCVRCGEPVLAPGERCRSDHRELSHLAFLVAPLRFRGTGGAMVRRFKLSADPAAGRWLAATMAAAFGQRVASPWTRAVFVAVPLHPRRRRRRGFDQAAWLARRVAARLGHGHEPAVLVRRRLTLPQGDPRVRSRSRNVAGAFAVVRSGAIRGRRVVLVDDVFTSGATARACAEALRVAGAAEVAILTACRS